MRRNQHIPLVRGDHLTVTYTIYDDSNSPKDLTGAAILAHFRDSDGALKFSKSTTDAAQILITDAVNGVFELYLVPADTSGLTAGQYPYDVQVTIAANVATVASGFLFLSADVTYT